ncbi:MAG: DUF4142 domain-containing protein [Hyphomicrobiales bacterium]|nr:DUF4142 domain-containing protein [Hyphomicrobiales bacterium]
MSQRLQRSCFGARCPKPGRQNISTEVATDHSTATRSIKALPRGASSVSRRGVLNSQKQNCVPAHNFKVDGTRMAAARWTGEPPGWRAWPDKMGNSNMFQRHLRLSGMAFAGILAAASAMSQSTAAPSISEGQILKYLQTVNHGEIADAKMALRRSKDADVKNFAKQMIKDHSANEKTMTNLARHLKVKPASGEATTSLMSEAKTVDQELKSAKGADFDKAYIEAQAKMHGEVADAIENQFIPAASSDDMKSSLSETLSTVQNHQKMAQDLSSKMQ